MPGYFIATGLCIACNQPFAFNPLRVPSSDAITGTREPVCRPCMDRINAKRRAMGLEPHPILDGAYEPADEAEWPAE